METKQYIVTDAHPDKLFAVAELTNYELQIVFKAALYTYKWDAQYNLFCKEKNINAEDHEYIFDKVEEQVGE
jgi:hypothetical protein